MEIKETLNIKFVQYAWINFRIGLKYMLYRVIVKARSTTFIPYAYENGRKNKGDVHTAERALRILKRNEQI